MPAVKILRGNIAPTNASVAVQYKRQWFWIADTDFRAKAMFGTVMLLFLISDIGVKGNGPIVTVPANGWEQQHGYPIRSSDVPMISGTGF